MVCIIILAYSTDILLIAWLCNSIFIAMWPWVYKRFVLLQEVTAQMDGGYLMIGDDTLISHCQLAAFDPTKVGPMPIIGSLG